MIHIYLNINNVSLCWQQSQNYCSNARCSSTVSSSWVVNLLVFTFNWCRLAGRPSTKRSLNRLHNTVTQVVIQPASVWNWKGKLWSSSSAAYAGLIHSILWMHAQRKRERERERARARALIRYPVNMRTMVSVSLLSPFQFQYRYTCLGFDYPQMEWLFTC